MQWTQPEEGCDVDKRTRVTTAVIAASAGLAAAGAEAIRRKGAGKAPAVPGLRPETPIEGRRAAYSPGPRANPKTDEGVVRRGRDSLAAVLGH
jgi:hypothetical protein